MWNFVLFNWYFGHIFRKFSILGLGFEKINQVFLGSRKYKI